jgi:hypothetical protein
MTAAIWARASPVVHTRVEVQERFNGTLAVYLDGHCIAKKVQAEPAAAYRTRGKRANVPESHQSSNRSEVTSRRWRPQVHGGRRAIIRGDAQSPQAPSPKPQQHEPPENRSPTTPQDTRLGGAATHNPQPASSFLDGDRDDGIAFRLRRRNRSTPTDVKPEGLSAARRTASARDLSPGVWRMG